MKLDLDQAGNRKAGNKHGNARNTTDGRALILQEIAAPIAFFGIIAACAMATNRVGRAFIWISLGPTPMAEKSRKFPPTRPQGDVPMRLATLTSVLVLVGAGYAFAGPGSGDPREPADPTSGRPAAVLDDAKCAEVWSLTEREGDALSQGQAAPFIVNFSQVDTNGDGKITEAEFKDGCKQGLIQEAAAAQTPSGETVPQSTEPVQELPGSGDAMPAPEPLPQ
jgi:hypothetical protein